MTPESGRPITLKDILGASGSGKNKVLKLADWFAGRLLLPFVWPASPVKNGELSPAAVKKILVLRLGGVGDAILLIPTIQRLKACFPQAEIDLLVEGRNVQIFSAVAPHVRRMLRYDKPPLEWWPKLQEERYDLIIDTEQWHALTAFLTTLLKSRVRVGFDTNPLRNRCYSVKVPYLQDNFEGDSFLSILEALTGSKQAMDWSRPFFPVAPTDAAWARELLKGRKPVCIALRASVRERCIEPATLRRLAGLLVEAGRDVCLLGVAGDADVAETVGKGLPAGNVLNMAGKTTLPQTAALLQSASLFIGTDSGLMHLAYSVGAPVVGIFGAGVQKKWGLSGTTVRILNRRLPCSPCTRFSYTPACPIGVKCLTEISAEEIFQAARELLDRNR